MRIGTIPTRSPLWPRLLVALALVSFAAVAGRRIALPGLDYDELIFVNAALGGASDSFVDRRLFGVPVMLMDYIGALKAYLYAPVFAVFGVSPETIRWPAILISLASIGLVYALARLSVGALPAAAAAALVALDPVFLFLTKLDFGPIVLMMALKLLALYCFYRAVATGSTRLLWVVGAACVLGSYDKLNFIWFAAALGVTALVLFRPELAAMYRQDRRGFLAPVAALAVALAAISVCLVAPQFVASQRGPASVAGRLPLLVERYARAMDGRELYAWVTTQELARPTIINYLTAAAVVALLGAWVARARAAGSARLPLEHRFVAAYLILFVCIAAQIAVTKRAGGPHHMMMLYPLHILLVIAAATLLASGRSRARQAVAALVVLAIAASEVAALRAYTQAFEAEERVAVRWSPVIYQLSAYLNRQQADRIVFVDWGMHNQVYALGNEHTRLAARDVWLLFRPESPAARRAGLLERAFRGRRVLAVMHPPDAEIIAGVQARFLAWADSTGLTLHPLRTFRDRAGRVMYHVYSVEENSRSAQRPNASTYSAKRLPARGAAPPAPAIRVRSTRPTA